MTRTSCLIGAALLLQASASFAQQPTSSAQPTTAATDSDFMLGLRRIGVLAGEAVICTPEATRNDEVGRVNRAGTLIATEFGMRAAFSFIGAAGYGAGLPFDKATCPAIMRQWTDVQQQYGEH